MPLQFWSTWNCCNLNDVTPGTLPDTTKLKSTLEQLIESVAEKYPEVIEGVSFAPITVKFEAIRKTLDDSSY